MPRLLRTRRLWLGVFVALGLADFLLTWWVVGGGHGLIVEANPLAAWWLEQFGWAGLGCFKAAVVLFTVGLCRTILALRPAAGSVLVGFACVAQGAVVVHGGLLGGVAGHRLSALPQEHADILRETRQLEVSASVVLDYRVVLSEVAADLTAGRCTLLAGVDRLARTAKARDGDWHRVLDAYYPALTPREQLAASIIQHVVVSQLPDRAAAREQARRLEAEFTSTFGKELETFYQGELGLSPARNTTSS